MKTKLISANYNKETGVSTATVRNKYGTFTAMSTLHPADAHIASSFAGCQYAETKAIIKSLKAAAKEIQLQIKTLIDFEKILKSKKDYNPHAMEARRLRRRIYELQEEYKTMKNRIQLAEETLFKVFNSREEALKNLVGRNN